MKNMAKWIAITFLFGFLLVIGCIQSNAGDKASNLSSNNSNTATNQNIPGAVYGEDDREFIYENTLQLHSGPVKNAMSNIIYAYDIYNTTKLRVKDCKNNSLGEYAELDCFENAAVYLADPSICLETPNDSWITNNCYAYYAIKTRNITACNLIDDSDHKSYCIQQLAIELGDSSICESDPEKDYDIEKYELCKEFSSSKNFVGKECSEYAYFVTEFPEFGRTVSWLSKNHPGENVLTWWDYGDDLDCMGLNSTISSKNSDDPETLHVAYLLVAGTEQELRSFMKLNGVKYLMVPDELVSDGFGNFGGKYDALNYLSCAYLNQTDVTRNIGDSECEKKHLPKLANSSSYEKYEMNYTGQDAKLPFYESILYKATFIGDLEGFVNVYTDESGKIKVFELIG